MYEEEKSKLTRELLNKKASEVYSKMDGIKMNGWEIAEVEVDTNAISIRCISMQESMCFPAFYKGIKIALIYCSGQIVFINRENWKKGWEFKAEYIKGNKLILKQEA